MTLEAGKTYDFTATQAQNWTVADECTADAHHFMLGARGALDFVMDRRSVASHQLDEPVHRGLRDGALPGDASVAQHDDPGGDIHYLMQLVADKDEGKPGPRSLPNVVAQLL